MSDRKLTLLGVVAAVILVWAVVQSSLMNRQTRPKYAGPATLIQGLDMSKVFGIELGTGGDAVTLKREGNHYVVASKDNYPASTKEINNLIADCLDIKREEWITDNAKNHEDLQVTEEKARNIIQFLNAKSEPIPRAGIVVGNTSAEGGGTYVRLASSDAVYLSRNVPYLRTTADKAVWNDQHQLWQLTNGIYFSTEGSREPRKSWSTDLSPDYIWLQKNSNSKSLMSSAQLADLVRSQHKPAEQRQAILEKHFRFTDPIINMVMLLLGLPLLVTRERFSSRTAFFLAIIGPATCFIVTFVCKLIGGDFTDPLLAAWLPLIVFLPLSIITLDGIKT